MNFLPFLPYLKNTNCCKFHISRDTFEKKQYLRYNRGGILKMNMGRNIQKIK